MSEAVDSQPVLCTTGESPVARSGASSPPRHAPLDVSIAKDPGLATDPVVGNATEAHGQPLHVVETSSGRGCALFSRWADCERYITSELDAKYRRFDNLSEAVGYLHSLLGGPRVTALCEFYIVVPFR